MTAVDVGAKNTGSESSTGLLTEIWEWISQHWLEAIVISVATAIFTAIFATPFIAIAALAFSPVGVIVLVAACTISLVLE